MAQDRLGTVVPSSQVAKQEYTCGSATARQCLPAILAGSHTPIGPAAERARCSRCCSRSKTLREHQGSEQGPDRLLYSGHLLCSAQKTATAQSYSCGGVESAPVKLPGLNFRVSCLTDMFVRWEERRPQPACGTSGRIEIRLDCTRKAKILCEQSHNDARHPPWDPTECRLVCSLSCLGGRY